VAKGKYEYWLTDDGLLLLSGWARDGLTDAQIAKNMGVSYSTFKVWKDKYPAISAALKTSKEIADREVENALFKRATGYRQQTVKVFQFQGEPVIVPVVEIVAPDVTAQIFWLKNRKPAEWREHQAATSNTDTGMMGDYVELLKARKPPSDT
jgi:hypothetical protein